MSTAIAEGDDDSVRRRRQPAFCREVVDVLLRRRVVAKLIGVPVGCAVLTCEVCSINAPSRYIQYPVDGERRRRRARDLAEDTHLKLYRNGPSGVGLFDRCVTPRQQRRRETQELDRRFNDDERRQARDVSTNDVGLRIHGRSDVCPAGLKVEQTCVGLVLKGR